MPCYDNSIHALQQLLQSGGYNERNVLKRILIQQIAKLPRHHNMFIIWEMV